MKNKIFKLLTLFVGTGAFLPTIAISSTSCSCSPNNDYIEFKSLSEFLNYDFNNWQYKMGVSCHKDYTENGKYENENDPEYVKNITNDLKLKESYLKYFLCQFVFGYREIAIANALGSIARNYNREEIYDLFKNASVNKFRLKFTFPKNIKWETKIINDSDYDVVSFSSFSSNLIVDDYSYNIFFDDYAQIYFSVFGRNSYFFKEDVLYTSIKTVNGQSSFHRIVNGTQYDSSYIDFCTIYTPNSDKIFNLYSDSIFA